MTTRFDFERFVVRQLTQIRASLNQVLEDNCLINQKLEEIMATQAELAQALTALGTQLDKAKAEIVQKVADLEAAIANAGSSTPEVDAALAALKGKVQELDDLNADAPQG